MYVFSDRDIGRQNVNASKRESRCERTLDAANVIVVCRPSSQCAVRLYRRMDATARKHRSNVLSLVVDLMYESACMDLAD